jgi:hypothetical protein
VAVDIFTVYVVLTDYLLVLLALNTEGMNCVRPYISFNSVEGFVLAERLP